jgi:tungstate transport system substrate-binding protein
VARFWIAILASLFCGLAGAAELRLGATHTLEDSGILPVLVAAFEAAHGIKVRVLVAGTGQVMKYAENGDVDAVFTHSRVDEEKLVASGIGRLRRDVMWNDFVIAGPASDPARIRGMRDAAAALKRIRDSGARFVSRGDDSGTHKTELRLWSAAGGLRQWPGYLSSGQGAGRALLMALELDAYDLVDRATLKKYQRRVTLAVLVDGDPRLLNEYAVTTITAGGARRPNERDAELFAAWLASPAGRKVIEGFRIEGEPVFHLPR